MIQKGVVYKSTGSWYSVKTEDGKFFDCKIKGKFRIKGIKSTNPIAVGDIVFIESIDNDTPIIFDIETRTNYLIRKATNLSSQSHIIAANIDRIYIIASLFLPRTSYGFIDRILVSAEAYHIPVSIVLNKIDLYDEFKDFVEEFEETYKNTGYEIIHISATKAINIDEFKLKLKNKTNLFVGHSGSGKSTLGNVIQAGLNLKMGELSVQHQKGKHTTTFAEAFDLDFGGIIIDTPGIKELGIYDLDKETISHRFPEIRNLLTNCKFNDCMHINEPKCAVLEALKNNQIAQSRYDSYLNIINSIS